MTGPDPFYPSARRLWPQPGTAAYVRRLWRHPEGGRPAEVQLIMGATLERTLGRCVLDRALMLCRRGAGWGAAGGSLPAPPVDCVRRCSLCSACSPADMHVPCTHAARSEAAAELLRSVRAGTCVRLTGRVQPHLQKGGVPARGRCAAGARAWARHASWPAKRTPDGLPAAPDLQG